MKLATSSSLLMLSAGVNKPVAEMTGRPVSVAVGVSFLGERYPPLVWAGIAVVALGIGLTTLAQARAARRT
mgnify:CR=1 FL=1